MENQHKKIKGCRDLTQIEINIMNKIKFTGEELGHMVDSLANIESTDKRWVALAKTNLQTGIMYAVRSVDKPTTF